MALEVESRTKAEEAAAAEDEEEGKEEVVNFTILKASLILVVA